MGSLPADLVVRLCGDGLAHVFFGGGDGEDAALCGARPPPGKREYTPEDEACGECARVVAEWVAGRPPGRT